MTVSWRTQKVNDCSLEDWREPSLRLHIHHDMAFVYHPVVLEGPATTYLISWGDAIVNANVARYLTNSPDRPADRIFHLFVKNVGRVSEFPAFQRKTHNQGAVGYLVLSRETRVRCG